MLKREEQLPAITAPLRMCSRLWRRFARNPLGRWLFAPLHSAQSALSHVGSPSVRFEKTGAGAAPMQWGRAAGGWGHSPCFAGPARPGAVGGYCGPSESSASSSGVMYEKPASSGLYPRRDRRLTRPTQPAVHRRDCGEQGRDRKCRRAHATPFCSRRLVGSRRAYQSRGRLARPRVDQHHRRTVEAHQRRSGAGRGPGTRRCARMVKAVCKGGTARKRQFLISEKLPF